MPSKVPDMAIWARYHTHTGPKWAFACDLCVTVDISIMRRIRAQPNYCEHLVVRWTFNHILSLIRVVSGSSAAQFSHSMRVMLLNILVEHLTIESDGVLQAERCDSQMSHPFLAYFGIPNTVWV
jgi:hypothetical protein